MTKWEFIAKEEGGGGVRGWKVAKRKQQGSGALWLTYLTGILPKAEGGMIRHLQALVTEKPDQVLRVSPAMEAGDSGSPD